MYEPTGRAELQKVLCTKIIGKIFMTKFSTFEKLKMSGFSKRKNFK